jgi:glutathione peroxidase
MTDFYSHDVKSIEGMADLLAPLRGCVALGVNVASHCGFTPQYAGLERLYRELKGQRFTVIGFPCNQFGGQEPADEREIIRFCTTQYDVTFPMSAKLDVKGPQQHPLFGWLTAAEQGVPGEIEWNFEKFLISRNGRILHRYSSGTKLEDPSLREQIGMALSGPL